MKPTERIDKNEKDIISIREQLKYLIEHLDKIENNHLEHIRVQLENLQNDLFAIKNKMAYWAGIVASVVIILDLLSRFVK